VLLLVIVWASLRLGLRGGSLVAGSATVLALVLAAVLSSDEALLVPLRGNLLAQCSTALLVGASADWIRASEARYRQVVGHIPVVLYSARLPRPLKPDRLRYGGRRRYKKWSPEDIVNGPSPAAGEFDSDLASGPVILER